MPRFSATLFAVCLIALASTSSCRPKDTGSALSPSIIARSRLSDGDLSQLQRVMAKARRGEPVTVGVIGGSITRGERATSRDRQYADRVARWWANQFPQSKITLVNAGISGTSSTYGCLRVQRDLIAYHPDFVIVEFGVNDPDKSDKPADAMAHAQTYEGLIRQLLADPDQPAVLLLFLMHQDGTNAQRLQGKIGRNYHLPMISYRDALWPEIAEGHMKLSDVFYDSPHPNDRGHAAIATFIDSLLQDTADHLPADADISPPSKQLPAPVFTDLYAGTKLIDADELKPVENDGWSYNQTEHCWQSNAPGSAITFDLTARAIDLLYEKKDGGYGTALVTVDGMLPMMCDSWLNGSWGPLCQTDLVIQGKKRTTYRIKIRLLLGKNPLSSGNEFHLLGFGLAG